MNGKKCMKEKLPQKIRADNKKSAWLMQARRCPF